MALGIKTFEMTDIKSTKAFADRAIGIDYYTEQELVQVQKRSIKNGENASFILFEGNKVLGLRFSHPHGNWFAGKGDRLSDHLWDFPMESTAYFQSLFIDPSLQKQGWGKKLSIKSIDTLRALGAKGVVCHSWLESPNGSSKKYLQAMGFRSVAIYREYWKNVDYVCPRDGNPCLCTAEEMYLNLENYP